MRPESLDLNIYILICFMILFMMVLKRGRSCIITRIMHWKICLDCMIQPFIIVYRHFPHDSRLFRTSVSRAHLIMMLFRDKIDCL